MFGMHRLLVYAGVGLVGTLAHYLCMIALIEVLAVQVIAASCAGYALGALVNYALNYRFTFNSSNRHVVALPKFMLVAAIGFFLNALIMQWLAVANSLPYLLAQLVATGTVLLVGYSINALWTFKNG